MKLLQLKNIKRNLLANLLLALTLCIGVNGCSWFIKKEIVPVAVSDYCDKYDPLPESKKIENDFNVISVQLFEYIKTNETTHVCDCLQKEQRVQCYEQFLTIE